jgi:hypothetical protein
MLFIKSGGAMSINKFFLILFYSLIIGIIGGVLAVIGHSVFECLPLAYSFTVPLSLFIISVITSYLLYRKKDVKKVFFITFFTSWIVGSITLYILEITWLSGGTIFVESLITKSFGLSILAIIILFITLSKRNKSIK